MAYIPPTELISMFVTNFRRFLQEILVVSVLSNRAASASIVCYVIFLYILQEAEECLDHIADDERLISFINVLPSCFSEMTKVVWSTTETPIDMIDEVNNLKLEKFEIYKNLTLFYFAAFQDVVPVVHACFARDSAGKTSSPSRWSFPVWIVCKRNWR